MMKTEAAALGLALLLIGSPAMAQTADPATTTAPEAVPTPGTTGNVAGTASGATGRSTFDAAPSAGAPATTTTDWSAPGTSAAPAPAAAPAEPAPATYQRAGERG